jgi:hypothetical protein
LAMVGNAECLLLTDCVEEFRNDQLGADCA